MHNIGLPCLQPLLLSDCSCYLLRFKISESFWSVIINPNDAPNYDLHCHNTNKNEPVKVAVSQIRLLHEYASIKGSPCQFKLL